MNEEWTSKSNRLESLIGKWNEKRVKEKMKSEEETRIDGPPGCFSPGCNGEKYKGCYSIQCRLRAKRGDIINTLALTY